jgi:hypothetical protein
MQRALKSDATLANRITFFLSGVFISAILFLTALKVMGNNGVFLALLVSVCLNVWLKKHRKTRIYTNSFNNGMITFNFLLVIGTVVIFVVFFGALQNLLN